MGVKREDGQLRRAGLLAALLCLVAAASSGCGHVPAMSLIQLARIDFASTDPADLRAAVKLPRAIEPSPRGVVLRVGVKLGSGHEQFEDFALHEASDPNDVAELERELEADTHVFAYRLEAREVARLNAFRDKLKAQQAASGGRGGALTIAIRPQACRTRDLSGSPIYVTTYLRTTETGRYVPLARDLDLKTMARDLAEAIPPCG
jgi:hypothetical protein